jgi:acyl carrier protein
MISDIETKEIIKKFISETSFADISKIKYDSLIFHEGFFDSMGLITLISFLEEKFSVQISDSDLIEENFESINAIKGFLERKKVTT